MEATHHTATALYGNKIHHGLKFDDDSKSFALLQCGVAVSYRIAISAEMTVEDVRSKLTCPRCIERTDRVLAHQATR